MRIYAVLILALIAISTCAVKTDVKVNPSDIKYLHLILSNHFDAGFGLGGFSKDVAYTVRVINLYFDVHFPQMVTNAKFFRGSKINYVYTTQPWLVYLYFHCPNSGVPSTAGVSIHCPSESAMADFADSITRGEITWHAFPFNSQIETCGPDMLAASIDLVHQLDDQFKVPRKFTLSQRDVPGIPIGAIPTLLKSGVKAVSVGVNGGSAPPDVPSIFRWQTPTNSSNEVYALWHPRGYGWYEVSDTVFVDGWDHALAFYWRGDNSGPGTPSDLQSVIAAVSKEFPNAQVQPVAFDTYVSMLDSVKSKLPVITSEVGDSWSYGISSDPVKTQKWRMLQRVVEEYRQEKELIRTSIPKEKVDQWNTQESAFMALIVKVSEHTWGVDFKTFLNDTTNWNNDQFEKVRNGTKYQIMITSWIEQRNYIDMALEVLGQDHPLRIKVVQNFKSLEALKDHPLKSSNKVDNLQWKTKQMTCGNWQFSFGNNGELNYLKSISSGRVWFDHNHTVSFFQNSFTYQDVLTFIGEYGGCGNKCPSWYIEDFGKPGMDKAQTLHSTYYPQTQSVNQLSPCVYSIQMTMSPNLYGPPSSVFLTADFNQQNAVHFTLNWYNKTTTRLPEAFWLGFVPVVSNKDGFTVDKVGYPTPALSAVLNGSDHLHGHWGAIGYKGNDGAFSLEAIDSGVVSFGIPSPFPTPFELPNPLNGVFFNLFNNIWDTNYPLWFPFLEEDASMAFRFSFTTA